MSRLIRPLFVMLGVLLLTAALAGPSLATGMPYQGRLTDAGGTPITGARDLTLTLYDGSSNILYQETWTAVSITNGLFSVEIGLGTPVSGSFTSSIFQNFDVYLGVTVGADPEMVPRAHLGFAPYSLTSLTSPGISAVHGTQVFFSGSGATTLGSTTITIPGPGYILVSGTGQLNFPASVIADFWISESNSAGVDFSDYGIVSTTSAGQQYLQFYRQRLYQKSAGTYTFFLRTDGNNTNAYLWQPLVTAIYIPTAMGTVSPAPTTMTPARQPQQPQR